MKKPIVRKFRCAVYTRKSSEEGLDMEFNSLDAQRESCEAYVASQKPEGWVLVPDRYDDGGFSGAPWSALRFSEHPHGTKRSRQAVGVAAHLSMEHHGWKQTGEPRPFRAFEHRSPHRRDHAEGRNHGVRGK